MNYMDATELDVRHVQDAVSTTLSWAGTPLRESVRRMPRVPMLFIDEFEP